MRYNFKVKSIKQLEEIELMLRFRKKTILKFSILLRFDEIFNIESELENARKLFEKYP